MCESPMKNNQNNDALTMAPPPAAPQPHPALRLADVMSVALDLSVYGGIGDAVTVTLR